METRIHNRIVVYMMEKIFFTTHIICWTCLTITFYQSGNANIKFSGVFEVARGGDVSGNKRYTFISERFIRRKRNNNPSYVSFSPLHYTLRYCYQMIFRRKLNVFTHGGLGSIWVLMSFDVL